MNIKRIFQSTVSTKQKNFTDAGSAKTFSHMTRDCHGEQACAEQGRSIESMTSLGRFLLNRRPSTSLRVPILTERMKMYSRLSTRIAIFLLFTSSLTAVPVTGTIKTWAANDKLSAADLNQAITSLKTGIESVPNWTKSGSNAYFTDGSVGIGTSSPNSSTLHIANATSSSIRLNATTPNIDSYIINDSVGLNLSMVHNYPIIFKTQNTERMRISNSGNVGIGTTNPFSKFHVSSGDIRVDNGYGIGAGGLAQGIYNAASGTEYIRFDVGGSERMIMSSSGTSIKTSTINEGLTNSNTTGGILKIISRAGAGAFNPITQANDHLITFYETSTNTGNLVIAPHSTSLSGIRILTNGNVGIGIANPTSALHVNGNAHATSYNNTSDGRYKENIKNIPSALEKVEKLKGVYYTWKQKEYKDLNFPNGQDLGFIGQEVEKVIPEVVYKDNKGFISLAYSKIIPVIVEAIKELKSKHEDKIETLKADNEILQKELISLKESNARITTAGEKTFSRLRNSEKQINDLEQENNTKDEKIKTLEQELSKLKKDNESIKQQNKAMQLSFEARLKRLEGMNYARK
ncbi:MAG: tail fiber domain-containing protein [Leptospiraceae bacterium]|nr:tail fiber domain-containing protein [Leptospiraceae bacterium]